MKKIWYFADSEYMDNIYGSEYPVCIDYEEMKRLAGEWEMSIDELMEQFHEATEDEIEMYGVYNG